MKFKFNNRYIKWGSTVVIVFCTCLLFYYLLFYGSNILVAIKNIYTVLMPIFFGFILAYLLTPTLNWLERKFLLPLFSGKNKRDITKAKPYIRALSIILTSLIYILIIWLIIQMLLSQIVPSVQNLLQNFEGYWANFQVWLHDILSTNPAIEEYVSNTLSDYSGELKNYLNETIMIISKSGELIKTVSVSIFNILKVLWNFIIGFIIAIYLMANKEKYANQAKKIVYAIWNKEKANVIINNMRFAHNTFIGFIIGKVIDSIIIGCLCFGGTSLLQTPYAALVSVVIGVTNVIPFFGPFLGAIPCSILILVVDPMHPLNFVYFALFILFLQQLDGNLIGPKILGDSTGLSSFWVIFAITLFGGILGIPGMIIGVPLFAIIYAAIKAHVNEALSKKRLSQETNDYTNIEYINEDGKHIYYDFSKSRKDENFHSGSVYISSVEEWKNYYNKRDLKQITESASQNNEDSE